MINIKAFSVGNDGNATVLRTFDPARRAQVINFRMISTVDSNFRTIVLGTMTLPPRKKRGMPLPRKIPIRR